MSHMSDPAAGTSNTQSLNQENTGTMHGLGRLLKTEKASAVLKFILGMFRILMLNWPCFNFGRDR